MSTCVKTTQMPKCLICIGRSVSTYSKRKLPLCNFHKNASAVSVPIQVTYLTVRSRLMFLLPPDISSPSFSHSRNTSIFNLLTTVTKLALSAQMENWNSSINLLAAGCIERLSILISHTRKFQQKSRIVAVFCLHLLAFTCFFIYLIADKCVNESHEQIFVRKLLKTLFNCTYIKSIKFTVLMKLSNSGK